jgi:hypothetical protein
MGGLVKQWHSIRGVIFAALLLAAVLAVMLWFPANVRNAAPGFGPDWECTSHPQSEPTCIKKVRP